MYISVIILFCSSLMNAKCSKVKENERVLSQSKIYYIYTKAIGEKEITHNILFTICLFLFCTYCYSFYLSYTLILLCFSLYTLVQVFYLSIVVVAVFRMFNYKFTFFLSFVLNPKFCLCTYIYKSICKCL